MQTHELFIALETGAISTTATGDTPFPGFSAHLLPLLNLSVAFTRNGVVVELEEDTPVAAIVKPSLSTAPLALDETATVTGTGQTTRYALALNLDSEELRFQASSVESVPLTLQIAWGAQGTADFGVSARLNVDLISPVFLPGDGAPPVLADAAWEWLKGRLPEGVGVTWDEENKTVTINPTETAHASTHTAAGVDPLTLSQSQITGLVAALALLAPLNSPTLTGTPTVPTASGGTNTTQAASTAFVQAAITSLIDSSPGALNTLNELAAALGDDANFASTVTTALAGKVPTSRTINGHALSANVTLSPSDLGITSGWLGQIVHASATLQGDTTAAVPGASAVVRVEVSNSWGSADTGTITVTVDGGTAVNISVVSTDPADGSIWVDSSSGSAATLRSALASATSSISGVTGAVDGDNWEVSTTGTSGANSLLITTSVPNLTVLDSGPQYGITSAPASGAVLSATLVSGLTGKQVKPLAMWVVGDLDVDVSIEGTNSTLLAPMTSPTGSLIKVEPDASTLSAWFNGAGSGIGVRAFVSGSPTALTGYYATVYLVAAQY